MSALIPRSQAAAWALWTVAAACVLAGLGGAPVAASSEALSPRNANYTIDVRLDAAEKILRGRQRVRWRNIQEQPTSELRFHLYWNGWRNSESTWLREDRHRGRSEHDGTVADEDWAYLEIESMTLVAVARGAEGADAGSGGGGGSDDSALGESESSVDLMPGLRFVAPDDGNPADRTLAGVELPAPVAPGDSIEVELQFRAKIPRTFARTGFRGNFFLLAHWFPKLAVFEAGGWSGRQFHSATEFYSDFGVYDVSLTVPEGWLVGATGREVERRAGPEPGTEIHRYRAEDVHGFAWTTSPDYVEFRDRFEEPGLPPVEIRLLMQPEHLRQAARHFDATRAALRLYGGWYGPYPYDFVTVIDPAYGSGAGGMEYPTLFTAGTRLWNPFGGGRPEGVTIHEAGHQFWYGVVANNEFDAAWLDEGLNSFSDARVYDEAYGPIHPSRRYFSPPGVPERRGFFPVVFREVELSRELYGNGWARYRRAAVTDVQSRPTWRYHPATASGISYSRTAIWLHTLERYLGWPRLREVLSAFYARWRFRHPRGEDFFATASEVAGEDLDWFFDEVVRSARSFDYAVDSVESWPIEPSGYFGSGAALELASTDGAEAAEDRRYRSSVVVRRLGDGRFPVRVRIDFEDGTAVERRWDGKYRWQEFVEEGPSRVRSATVDPDRILLLDVNYTNNTRYRREQSRWPAVKWAGRWQAWLQDVLHAVAYFV